MLPFEDGFTAVNIFGLSFVSVWTLLALTASVFGFLSFGEKIVIDWDGVTRVSLLRGKTLSWGEIADWGLSYCGQTCEGGLKENTYYLYFSKSEQKSKNKYGKRLRGDMIKMNVIGENYREVTQNVVPFCRRRALVKPFIGEDAVHFM